MAKPTFTTLPGEVAVLNVLKGGGGHTCVSDSHRDVPHQDTTNLLTWDPSLPLLQYTQGSSEVRVRVGAIDHVEYKELSPLQSGDTTVASEGNQVHLRHYTRGRVGPERQWWSQSHVSTRQTPHYPSARHHTPCSLGVHRSHHYGHTRLTRSARSCRCCRTLPIPRHPLHCSGWHYWCE